MANIVNKIRKWINKRKDLLILMGIVFVMALCIFSVYYLNNLPFEYGGDLKRQYYPFSIEFKELLKNSISTKTLPFYSWNMFLGTNFWASKSFYFLGDIFSYITAILPLHFFTANMLVIILKLLIGSATFYYLLDEYEFKSNTKVIFSICYIFSSWMLCFIEHTMFISFYAWVPLYFMGVERYLRKNKTGIFLFATTILFFTNYYLLFPLTLITPIYYIYRYYNLKNDFKSFLKDTIKLIAVYFFGFGISSIVMLPTIDYMLQNQRIGDFYVYWKFWIIESYYHLLQGMFLPNQLYLFSPNNLYDTTLHNTREVALYAGSITVLLLTQFITDKVKKFRNSTIVLYLIIIALIATPMGNIVLMGLGDVSFRWTYIIIIINILVAARYFDNHNLFNKRTFIVTLVIGIAINLISIPMMLSQKEMFNLFSFGHYMYIVSIIGAILLLIYGFVMIFAKNKRNLIILILVIIECILINRYTFQDNINRLQPNWETVEGVTKVLQDYKGGLKNSLMDYDSKNIEQFFRTYIQYDSLLWNYSYNGNLFYQIPSVITYDTTMAPSLTKIGEWFPETATFGTDWSYEIKEPNLIDFLSIKYAIVTDPSQLPHEDFVLIDDNFRWGLLLYENTRYQPVGQTYNEIIKESTFEKNINSEDLAKSIIAKDKDYDEIKGYINPNEISELINVSYYGNQFHGYIETSAPSFMILKIPYDKGWKILNNNEVVEYYDVNGGFIGIKLDKGINQIDMYFTPVKFKLGLIITCLSLLATIYLYFIHNRNSK